MKLAWWCALLLAGQAATLALVRAGPAVGYQHLVPPWHSDSTAPVWALTLLGVEAAAVLVLLARRRVAWWGALRSWGWTRVALVLGLTFCTGATLSRDPADFAAELVLALLLQLLHLGAAYGALATLPRDRVTSWLHLVLDTSASDVGPPARIDRFTLTVAGCVVIGAALLAVVAYQRHPHVPDEVSYLLQARYFAEGMLAMPAPPVREAFDLNLMTYEATRWYSPFPPGWPAILALGARAGVPWLVNPLLGGVAVLLTHLLLAELYPRRTARLATLLLATSPWLLFLAMSLMSHVASLVAALMAALGVARSRRTGSLGWMVAAGASLGVVGLIRPLEGVVMALLLGIWSLGARGRRLRLAPSAVLTVSTIAVGSLVFPYNAALTGNPRHHPVMEYMNATFGPGANDLGFGPNRGSGWEGLDPLPGHGAADVAINADFNAFQVATELHGWAAGSLLLLAVLLAGGRLQRADWWMLAVIAGVVAVHSLYYFSGGPDFGARYWFLTIVPLVALTARGAEARTAPWDARAPGAGVLLAALLTVSALVVFVPWRAMDKYHHYRGMEPGMRSLLRDPGLGDAVLLVRGQRHPDYASAAIYNPLRLDAREPIVAWDRGDTTRARIGAAYPDRRFVLVDGPTITGDGYRRVSGLLSGEELLRPRAD